MQRNDPHEGMTAGNGQSTAWDGGGRHVSPEPENDVPLGELLKRLTADTSALVSQEITLAKAELKQSATTATQQLAKLGIAAAVGLLGAIALNAFAIIALGAVLDDRYWLSALIVGAIELAVGGILAKDAMSAMKNGDLKPAETIGSLSENKAWAGRELKDLKREMSSSSKSPISTDR